MLRHNRNIKTTREEILRGHNIKNMKKLLFKTNQPIDGDAQNIR